MHQLGEIGAFQFENLIRGRIPFKLILIGQAPPRGLDHDLLLPVWERTVSLSVNFSVSEVQEQLPEKGIPVVLGSEKPEEAKAIAKALDELGYLNCYYLGMAWSEAVKDLQEL